MATQMQQIISGRTVRAMVVAAVGLAGVVTVGAALWSSHPQAPTTSEAGRAIVTTNPALGTDAPTGAIRSQLPAGYTDYFRSAPVAVATNPALGVDAPTGVDVANLPTGYTDYIRTNNAILATNPVLGINAPAGVDVTTVPAGYRDYIRHP